MDEPALSLRIVGAVADVMGIDPVDCPPLFEAINPDALDTLFEGKKSRGSLVFEYAGYIVTVDNG
ncbi:HalOD1 output domain-containing protein [Halosolutus amylolyticus]|uniref:HalOD1 output domain-containing protein n=1 Tax=Halosolutus amylolyticus TaxID=2932267 RepID=A0ABD5PPL9_9EURY|nr:HalOD1 output domain-containing protein [Halosolutus amylolyticus]